MSLQRSIRIRIQGIGGTGTGHGGCGDAKLNEKCGKHERSSFCDEGGR